MAAGRLSSVSRRTRRNALRIGENYWREVAVTPGIRLNPNSPLRRQEDLSPLVLGKCQQRAFIRPISACYPAWLSFLASERILVRRLERRSRQRLGGPSDRHLRNISSVC